MTTMMRRTIVLLLLPLGSPAAESLVVETGPMRVSITEDVCAGLVTHTPAPDVEYRPGVDVDGRQVAPADLPGRPRIEFPETYRIPIEVDISDRFGIPADPMLFDGAVQVGTVTLADGRLYFNGQPLSSQGEAAVAQACRDALR